MFVEGKDIEDVDFVWVWTVELEGRGSRRIENMRASRSLLINTYSSSKLLTSYIVYILLIDDDDICFLYPEILGVPEFECPFFVVDLFKDFYFCRSEIIFLDEYIFDLF